MLLRVALSASVALAILRLTGMLDTITTALARIGELQGILDHALRVVR